MSVEELEKLRIKVKNKILIGIFFSLFISIVALFFIKLPPIIVFILAIGIIITELVTKGEKRKFTLLFKSVFVESTLKRIFTDIDYKPEIGLDKSIISSTEMMNMGDRYSSNDYVKGKYKNINFEQADVHIEEERTTTDSDGHTRTYYVTVFRGKWMIFDFNKEFKANVQIFSKGFRNATVNTLFSKTKYEKVELEDIDFNKCFKTYAQDEHEAFYIVTPSLMERIKKVKINTNGEVLLCFINNRLHVGLQNGKDSFEHGIFTKIDESKITENLSEEIKAITQFVDELNLDNNLFRREV